MKPLDDLNAPFTKKEKITVLAEKQHSFLLMPMSHLYFFQSSNRMTYAYDKDGHKHTVMNSLNKLEEGLPPSLFFRANRAFLVNGTYIEAFWPVKRGQFQIRLRPPYGAVEIIVSRVRSSRFAQWVVAL